MTELLSPPGGLGIGRQRAIAGAREAGPLAVAGMLANGANVVVTVVLARLLSVRGYGSLNQLVSVYLVLAMPGSALLVAVVRRVTAWEVSGAGERVAPWADRVRRRGLEGVLVVGLLAFLGRHWVAARMSLPNAAGVPEILMAGAAWGLLCIERGVLQARRSYRRLARNLVVEGGARTVLTLGLVAAGLGVTGATLGLLGGVSVALLDGVVSVSQTRSERPAAAEKPEPEPEPAATGPRAGEPRHLGADVLTALGALALLAVLQSADVVVVGRLAPGRVGEYAAVAVASKALAFGALVLCGFLLPEAATRFRRGEHALHELGVAFAVLAVPAVALITVSSVAHRQLLSLFFGTKLAASSAALTPLAAAMALLGATILLTHYLLGFGRRVVVAVLAAGTVVEITAMAGAGGRPVATAWRDLAAQALVLAAVGLCVARLHPRRARA